MGAFESCFGGNDEVATPDPDVRRQQMLAAAERRKKESEERGIKNPERVKEQQRKKMEAEDLASRQPSGNSSGGLKWQVH